MSTHISSNSTERFLAALLTLFFAGFGWVTLLQGGIALKGKSGHVTYVTGGFAVGVAVSAFLFAALTGLLLAKSFSLGRRGVIAIFIAVLLPPIAFLLLPG